MYDPRNIFRKQPVAVASALKATLHALVLLGVLGLTGPQLAGIAIAAELVLGLFAWNAVTPVDNMERHPEGDPQ